MIGFLSKIFGGSKSEKDVKKMQPVVAEINQNFAAYRSLSNDELRGKTAFFRDRVKDHLSDIEQQIADKKAEAEQHHEEDIQSREAVYNDVDKLIKKKDELIEEILLEIQPEAFAVMKETARRFKEHQEMVSTATD